MLATGKLASPLLLALLFLAPDGFAAEKAAPKKGVATQKDPSDAKPAAEKAEPTEPTEADADTPPPADDPAPTTEKKSASVSLTTASRGEAEDEEPQADSATSSSPGTGFYLRATVGGGHAWGHAEKTATQPDVAMQAVGGAVMLQPGYQVLPGFAVHGDLYASMLFAHRLRSEDEALTYEAKKIGLIAPTIGVGVTYHSLPDDLFVSAGVGVSAAFGSRWLDIGLPGVPNIVTEPAMTNPGFAAHGSIGKLFPVHRRWAIGGALNYNFQTFGSTDDVILTVERAHSLWLGFSTAFHPAR